MLEFRLLLAPRIVDIALCFYAVSFLCWKLLYEECIRRAAVNPQNLKEPFKLGTFCERLAIIHGILIRFSFVSQNTVHVAYPRNTRAYSDATTSPWMNHKGYTTFA